MSTTWKPDVLVLGPGGIKGFLELGALFVLQNEKFLDQVHTYIGVSVGAVISLLLVSGYSVKEIITAAADTNLFQDIKTINLTEAKNNIGLISNSVIRDKLTKLLRDKFPIPPTLKQLYTITNKRLISVTYNLTKGDVEYMDHNNFPDIVAVDAIMLSMNIPFLFFKLKYMASVYIDGAFGDPYPVLHCDDGKNRVLGIYVDGEAKPETIINKTTEVVQSKAQPPAFPESLGGEFASYLHSVILVPLKQLRRYHMVSASANVKHLGLYTSVADSTGLSVDAKQKSQMVTIGYKSATSFLRNLNPPVIPAITPETKTSEPNLISLLPLLKSSIEELSMLPVPSPDTNINSRATTLIRDLIATLSTSTAPSPSSIPNPSTTPDKST